VPRVRTVGVHECWENELTSPDEPMADTQDMFMVHTMFRREFAALPALVRDATVDGTERAQVIAEHVGLLMAVLDAHHRAEDAHLWPRLLDRGGDLVGPVVHLMEGQHERIEQFTIQAVAALGQWRIDAAVERGGRLADLLGNLHAALFEHMSLEEHHILPLAERYVTAAEWRAMAGTTGAGLPPGRMPLIFGMILYEADPEVIEDTLSSLPPGARTMLEDQGPRDFAAHCLLVHGTAKPARSAPLSPSDR
jgi:hypothetical protein